MQTTTIAVVQGLVAQFLRFAPRSLSGSRITGPLLGSGVPTSRLFMLQTPKLPVHLDTWNLLPSRRSSSQANSLTIV
jgi:hypothetical protein